MIRLMVYGPYICIAFVLTILFILWAFWGGQNYEFIGLAPLDPDTCGSYTGSVYNWGNITPVTGYDPINGETCIPQDVACKQEPPQEIINSFSNDTRNPDEQIINSVPSHSEQEIQQEDIVCPQETNTHSISIKNNYNSLNNLPQPTNPTTTFKNKNKGKFISKGERVCCQTMERIYGVSFNSIRPNWLKNPETGYNMELDCYNDDLKIAVEYNGIQHYKWPNHIHSQTEQEFINQVRRDEAKLELCDKNGVYLIVVPYTIPLDKIPEFIMSHLPETIQKRIQEEHILNP